MRTPRYAGRFKTNRGFGSLPPICVYLQPAKSPSARPVFAPDFISREGMIASVSTFAYSNGAAIAVRRSNFSISAHHAADIGDAARDRAGGHRLRARDVCSRIRTLTAFEVAVRRGDDSLTLTEALTAREEAHRAAGLSPLEPRVSKDAIEPLRFGLPLDGARAGHADRLDALGDPAAAQDCSRATQVGDAAVRA